MRKIAVLFTVLMVALSPALVTAQEPVPCDSCSGYPEGAFMTSGGPELSGDVHELSCQSGTWEDATGDPCSSCTPISVGTNCANGSYYIGDIGAGSVYATNKEFESSETWNDGNANFSNTGATSTTDGEGNTATLVTADSDDGVAGTQPHDAAIYCDSLIANGHGDWYLPAQDELDLFWNSGSPVANVDESGTFYWSSSESSSSNAWSQRFNVGSQNQGNKGGARVVRCVRR